MSEKMKYIFVHSKTIIDIGGGLRAVEHKGNRFDPSRAWMRPYLEKVDYKVMDPVPDYSPDIVGDIHNIPLSDNSIDAVVCNAVLEHVENPVLACKEVYRILKPGGLALFYVPFLFYYHAEVGYYKDYWRFTHDAIEMLFKDFSTVETSRVRGAIATWIHISPLGRFWLMKMLANLFDVIFKKRASNQVSGYYIFVKK